MMTRRLNDGYSVAYVSTGQVRDLPQVRLRPLVLPRIMTAFLLVGLGGAIGSMARYGMGLALPSAGFPYATLAVNVIGCFCIGLAMPSVARVETLPPELRLLVVVGFLGGFTTFSAFGNETVSLLRSGGGLALVNVAANILLGLAAVVLGRTIAS